MRFVLLLVGSLLVLWWSFEGAKIKPTELMEGIPQIAVTIGRMLPPDFTRVTDAKSYLFPEEMPLSTLLLLVPVSGDQARIKQAAAIVSVLIVLVMLVDYASYRLRKLVV